MADRQTNPVPAKNEPKPLSSAQTDASKPAIDADMPAPRADQPFSAGADGQLRPDRPFDSEEDAVEALQENVERRAAGQQGDLAGGMLKISDREVERLEERLALDPDAINTQSGFDAGESLENARAQVEAEIAERNAAALRNNPYRPTDLQEPRSNRLRNIVAARQAREVDVHLLRAAELRQMFAKGVQGETSLDPNELKRLEGKHPAQK